MKKVLLIFCLLIFSIVLFSCIPGIELHEHTYSDKWSLNNTEHWHAATCGHTDEVIEKAKHGFDDWKNGKRNCTVCGYIQSCEHDNYTGVVTTEPTCTTKGVKTYTCSVCGQTITEEIGATGHQFSSEWSSDITYHWYAAICDHTDEVSEKAEHLFGKWENGKQSCMVCGYILNCEHNYNSGVVTTEPTCTIKGVRTYRCSACGQTITEEIEATGHLFSSSWTKDIMYHWHAATCGHTYEVSEKAEHLFDEWIDGKRNCSLCGYVQNCEHEYNSGVVTTTPTCTAEGVITFTCSICGKTKDEEIEATGHQFSSSWSNDSINHWHKATCNDTNEVREKGEHRLGEWKDGKRSCSVCDYIQNCEHNLNSGVVTTEPTCTEKGERTNSCPCGMVVTTEEISATGHSIDSGTATKTPGCFTKGTRTFKCKVCEEILRTEEIDALGWCESVIDAEIFEPANNSSTYVYFGVFPQTILPSDTTITIAGTPSITMGSNVYYEGSDGEYYVKVRENADRSNTTYSDGSLTKLSSDSSTRYFKVEPLKWKVLTTDYNSTGKNLLLAENILTAGICYYSCLYTTTTSYGSYSVVSTTRTIDENNVYASNYKYSTIRAYLNGKYETDDVQTTTYKGKGFLQTAFTDTAQNLISTTNVINNGLSTTNEIKNIHRSDGYYGDGIRSSGYLDYTCADTQDKIFLLSVQEATTTSYGFGSYSSTDNTRIRTTTDFAKANNAFYETDTAGYWWLRSPKYNDQVKASYVTSDGDYCRTREVSYTDIGVVPALVIEF